jgi:chorismate mutase
MVMLRRACISLTIGLLATHCATRTQPPRQTDELGRLMVERLSWMDEVAAIKHARHLPVFDPVREKAVLQSLTTRAVDAGIDPSAAQAFVVGQIAAARQLQEEWLARHRTSSPRRALPDLDTEVRPQLDRITASLIASLARSRSSADAASVIASAQRQLAAAGYSAAVSRLAIDGLRAGLGAD